MQSMKLISEVAELLNIRIETLRLWCQTFDLDIERDASNQRIFSDENVEVLQKIAALKDQKKTTKEIKDMLNLGYIQKPESQRTQQTQTISSINLDEISKLLDNKIEPIMELSEKYSRATYEIGTLKAQLEAVKEARDRENILLLENKEKDSLLINQELENKTHEIQSLKSQLHEKDNELNLALIKVQELSTELNALRKAVISLQNENDEIKNNFWYKTFSRKKGE